MTRADEIFERFPDFIRDFIYNNTWESLRPVQMAAAHTLFETDHNLLLTSSTASGKTEAVFFPILTELWDHPSSSIGVIYIAPLKSLINDQFFRIEQLLDQSGIPVTHWHGDVAASHKRKLLENPKGVLQITPESLEAMLIGRSNDIPRLFGDLRYVVIDEIHTLTGTDRGNQIRCQLERITHLIGHDVRRVGLSATIGDPEGLPHGWERARVKRPTCRALTRERSAGDLAWSTFTCKIPRPRKARTNPRRTVRSLPKPLPCWTRALNICTTASAPKNPWYFPIPGRRPSIFAPPSVRSRVQEATGTCF